MFALYRCAACGSPNVRIDNKSEGYSLAKGVIGTALLGPVGAVAGIGGKTKQYYHCPDCGITLSYPMGIETSKRIYNLLENASANSSQLEVMKSIYKNIEWEPTKKTEIIANNNQSENSWALKKLARPITAITGEKDEDITEILMQLRARIQEYIRLTNCKQFTGAELEKALGVEQYDDVVAGISFYSNKRFTFETWLGPALSSLSTLNVIDIQEDYLEEDPSRRFSLTTSYYRNLYTVVSEEERKVRALEEMNTNMAQKITRKHGKKIKEDLISAIEPNVWLNESEFKSALFNCILSGNYSEDLGIIELISSSVLEILIKHKDVIEGKTDDNGKAYMILDDIGRQKLEEEKRRQKQEIKEEKRRQEQKNVEAAIDMIKQKTNDAKKLYTYVEQQLFSNNQLVNRDQLPDIRNRDSVLSGAYSIQELEELLFWCVKCGLLEYHNSAFSKPGVHIRILEQKKRKINQVIEELRQKLSNIDLERKENEEKTKLQSQIYEANKNKIFGNGKKMKKESADMIALLSTENKKLSDEWNRLNNDLISKQQELNSIVSSYEKDDTATKMDQDKSYQFVMSLLSKGEQPMNQESIVRKSRGCFEKNPSASCKKVLSEMCKEGLLLKLDVNEIPYYIQNRMYKE